MDSRKISRKNLNNNYKTGDLIIIPKEESFFHNLYDSIRDLIIIKSSKVLLSNQNDNVLLCLGHSKENKKILRVLFQEKIFFLFL